MLPDQATRRVTEMVGPGNRLMAAQRLRLGRRHVNHALAAAVDASNQTHRESRL